MSSIASKLSSTIPQVLSTISSDLQSSTTPQAPPSTTPSAPTPNAPADGAPPTSTPQAPPPKDPPLPPASPASTEPVLPPLNLPQMASTPSDPEKQGLHTPPPTLPSPSARNFGSRLLDFILLPYNMWAPLPDYGLSQRLKAHPDEQINNALHKVLIGAEALRTVQWRIAYWTVTLSLIATLGTALIGIANAILSFNDHPTASKTLSIFLAGFGVALSLLKGTGQPAGAFAIYNRTNDIIDAIEDFATSGGTVDPARIDAIKAAWRQIRDISIVEQANIWKNIQK